MIGNDDIKKSFHQNMQVTYQNTITIGDIIMIAAQ